MCGSGSPRRRCSTTSTTPSAVRSAVSTESAIRLRSSSRTHQPVHHHGDVVVLRGGPASAGSRRSSTSPSTRARTNPFLRSSSKRSRNSPFRPRTSGARISIRVPSSQAEQAVHDLGGALPAHRLAAARAVRRPHPRPEQAQVVVDLRDRTHRGARVAARGLLLDGDGRGEPLDGVDVRLLHQPQELPGVGGERLHVAPLPLGVDGVEGQRRLARSRSDPVMTISRSRGMLDVDVLEVVLAGAADDERILRHPEKLPQVGL